MFRNAAAKMAQYKINKEKEKLAGKLVSAAASGDLDAVLQILRDTNNDLAIINYVHPTGFTFVDTDGTKIKGYSGNAVNAAAISGQLATLKALLSVPGVEINFRDADAHLYTPFAAAIVYENNDIAIELAARPDLDPNLDDVSGLAPIIHATSFCLPVIPLLLKQPKLDPNVTGGSGRTALHLLCNSYVVFPVLNDCIQQMARHPAIKVDARDNKMYTPLMYAAANGNSDACMALLEAGANKTLLNEVDCTAERLAELNGHKELAKLIREFDHGCEEEREQSAARRLGM